VNNIGNYKESAKMFQFPVSMSFLAKPHPVYLFTFARAYEYVQARK